MINILEYLEKTPDFDQIAFADTTTELTFAQLYQHARAIGSFLAAHGSYKQPIPVLMEKSPRMIAAFLGVVYSGNVYVPLDAAMSESRIGMIVEKINPLCMVCDASTRESAHALLNASIDPPIKSGCDVYEFSTMVTHAIDDDALRSIRRRAVDVDPVYVVFTSGSTGIPKGIVANHRAVIDYIESLCPVLDVNAHTVFGNQSPLYLDACLKEIFPTLKYGAKTFLIPPSLFSFPVRLIEWINDRKINTICWVSSALSLVAGLGALEKQVPKTLKLVAFGSEVLPQKHLAKWRESLPNAKFLHLYGPTETTGMAAYFVVNRDFAHDEPLPIGRPFPNREIILLTDDGKMPDPGEPGEIHIRGSQLSLGYFADKKRTAAAFVQNPLSPFPDILYKTGDLGYQNADGDFVFIARRDHQIKHMGHRIELTEIEAAARCLDGIEMACAIFDAEKSRIIFYYVSVNVDNPQLRLHLKSVLPRYMQPHEINRLETMPLTPGGKIDRMQLKGLK